MDIRDIAREAGVSPSTVSRILNGTKPVSPELRERVDAVVVKIGYVPNQSARSMVTKRTNTIGIVLPEVSFFFHQTIVQVVEERLAAEGYRLIVASSGRDSAASVLTMLAQRTVDGLILMFEPKDEAVEKKLLVSGIPLITATVRFANPVAGVRIDDRKAVIEGVNYLFGLGHRKIGLISGDGRLSDKLRREGFIEAVDKLGLSPEQAPVSVCRYSLEEGYRSTKNLLEKPSPPTALFVLSDEMAIGAIRAASDLGFPIPEKLSILGFDGIELGAFIRPALTTVAQPLREIGIAVSDGLIYGLRSGSDPEDTLLPHSLVIRESCGCPCS